MTPEETIKSCSTCGIHTPITGCPRAKQCDDRFSEWQPKSSKKMTPTEETIINNTYDIWSKEQQGIKHDTGKPPISLLHRSFVEGTAQVMAYGAQKYGRFNFCKGMNYTRLSDAAMRHLIAWVDGEDLDPESGLPHLFHAAASINMLCGNIALSVGKDDRYGKDH